MIPDFCYLMFTTMVKIYPKSHLFISLHNFMFKLLLIKFLVVKIRIFRNCYVEISWLKLVSIEEKYCFVIIGYKSVHFRNDCYLLDSYTQTCEYF